MYFHIIVETKEKVGKNSNYETLYEYDKTDLDQIKTDLVIPYLKKDKFQFKGYFLSDNNVRRIAIKRTTTPIDVIRDAQQQKVSRNVLFFWSKDMVVESDELVEDITSEVFSNLDNPIEEKAEIQSTELSTKKVFIVHGHDDSMKLDVARFLEILKLEPIILHEQSNSGLTIIEKIEKYSQVGYAIVLYSPCDVGSKNIEGEQPRLRARQNVVFEHGFLIGKLGRNRVSALVKDDIEKPGDISGVVYINYDGANWSIEIAKELRDQGYSIDLNLL